MLKRPDNMTSRALVALENDPNFIRVLDWMKDSLQDLNVGLHLTKDEVITRWQQGAAQAVSDFIHAAADARKSAR